VTVFVASLDNLTKRDPDEVAFLMAVCEDVVADRLTRPESRWQVHVAGRLEALPASTARALERAVDLTTERVTDSHLTLAIGYGGRAEVVDAVRSLLVAASTAGESAAELADRLTTGDIGAHLYTSGRPEPDLVIRTSGEQRLSDFLLWQTTGSHLWFADVYWPGFREVDLLRAVRAWAAG
jgi:short-chain Z-isoprenyl diphosphate synthase